MVELIKEIKQEYEMLTNEQREELKTFAIFLGSNFLNLNNARNRESEPASQVNNLL